MTLLALKQLVKAILKNTGFDLHPFGCYFLQVA